MLAEKNWEPADMLKSVQWFTASLSRDFCLRCSVTALVRHVVYMCVSLYSELDTRAVFSDCC